MTLRDIYYYFVSLAMMAGVIIAYILRLDIDQGPNGRIRVRFGSSSLSYKLRKE